MPSYARSSSLGSTLIRTAGRSHDLRFASLPRIMAPRGWPARKRVHHVAGKRATYQTAKTMAFRSGMMGGLFGPTGSDFPMQTQVRSKEQYIPTAAGEDVRHTRTAAAAAHPSRYSLTDLDDLRVPSSTKLMGHLTRLQDELRGCISAGPLMPSDRLLDQALQDEMPRVSLWSSSRMPNSESIEVGKGGSVKQNDRLNSDAKPVVDIDLDGLESLESSVARESLRYSRAWRPELCNTRVLRLLRLYTNCRRIG